MPPISVKNAKVVAGVVGAMNPGWSLLGDEPFRRRYAPRAEIVVPGTGNANEALGGRDQAIEPLAERHGDDSVVLTVHHEHRRRDLAPRFVSPAVRWRAAEHFRAVGHVEAPENGADRVLSCTLIVTAANAFTRGLID
jgi:hypothetical protein